MAGVVEAALAARRRRAADRRAIERGARPRPGGRAPTRPGEARGRSSVEGSHLLVAAGRRPVMDGLGLEAAGIAADRTGIVVDRGLRTANRRVYAIGDCAGGAAGGLPLHPCRELPCRARDPQRPVPPAGRGSTPRAIPRVTYTDPELAAVGLSEEEARAAAWRRPRPALARRRERPRPGRAHDPRPRQGGRDPARPHPRLRHRGAAGRRPDRALGARVAKGLKVQDLAGLVFPYPTLSEVSKRAAVEFLRGRPETRGCAASSASCAAWAERWRAHPARLGTHRSPGPPAGREPALAVRSRSWPWPAARPVPDRGAGRDDRYPPLRTRLHAGPARRSPSPALRTPRGLRRRAASGSPGAALAGGSGCRRGCSCSRSCS